MLFLIKRELVKRYVRLRRLEKKGLCCNLIWKVSIGSEEKIDTVYIMFIYELQNKGQSEIYVPAPYSPYISLWSLSEDSDYWDLLSLGTPSIAQDMVNLSPGQKIQGGGQTIGFGIGINPGNYSCKEEYYCTYEVGKKDTSGNWHGIIRSKVVNIDIIAIVEEKLDKTKIAIEGNTIFINFRKSDIR